MYNGRVTVGGPADVHELGRLLISKLAVGPYNNNCYLLRCRETGTQVLVDAAAEPDRIMDLIGPDGHRRWSSRPTGTRTTGRPWPRSSSAPAPPRPPTSSTRPGSPSRPTAHPRRRPDRGRHAARSRPSTSSATRPARSRCCTTTRTGQPHLITGDCLFPGGVGKTHVPEDFESLYAGVVGEALRPAARRDLGLPRPRLGHDDRRRAPRTWPSGGTAGGDPPPFLPETGTNRR